MLRKVSALVAVVAASTILHSTSHAESWYETDADLPIVISPSRLRQTITDAPTAITIIDRELIELSGARSIADLLLLVPGFQVSRYLNGYPVVTYHGQTTRFNPQLQLIIDGRPAYIPLYGGIPWGDLPLAVTDIERIEVVRSPNAATFGPNSFFAVISITTISVQAEAGWTLHAEAGGNQFGSAILSNTGSRKNTDYRVTLQLGHDEGFSEIRDTERDKKINVYSTTQINNQDNIKFDFGFARSGYIEFASVVEFADLDPYRDVNNGFLQLGWERSLSSEESDSINYHFSRFSMNETQTFTYDVGEALRDPELLGVNLIVPLSREAESSRHEVEFERTRKLNDKHRVNLGGALRYDLVKGQYIFNDNENHEIYTGRVFINSEYKFSSRWLLNSGLMYENNSISDSTLIPRIATIYKKQNNTSYRFSYSRGVRTPLLLEIDGEVNTSGFIPAADVTLNEISLIGNSELKPEGIDVYELGFIRAFPVNRIQLDAKLSRQIVKRNVGTALVPIAEDTFNGEARIHINEEKEAEMSNIEFQLEAKPKDNSRFRLSYSHAFDFDSLLDFRQLTPEHTLSLFGSYISNTGYAYSAEYFHISDWIWDDVRDTSRMNRLDLRVAKNLRLGNAEGKAYIQAELYPGKNLDYLQRNNVENKYFAGLSLSWH